MDSNPLKYSALKGTDQTASFPNARMGNSGFSKPPSPTNKEIRSDNIDRRNSAFQGIPQVITACPNELKYGVGQCYGKDKCKHVSMHGNVLELEKLAYDRIFESAKFLLVHKKALPMLEKLRPNMSREEFVKIPKVSFDSSTFTQITEPIQPNITRILKSKMSDAESKFVDWETGTHGGRIPLTPAYNVFDDRKSNSTLKGHARERRVESSSGSSPSDEE
jgi:hypothetical protein